MNLTRELAAQWTADGIHVNCIARLVPSEIASAAMDERGLRYLERTAQTAAVDGGWTRV